jgi:hypothetical protein
MRKGNSEPLSAEQISELERLATSPDAPIDTSDSPEATDWSGAVRGNFYRPRDNQNTAKTQQHKK